MPKQDKGKNKTKKVKKLKYPEAKIQLFDYDLETGTKKENKEKAKQQRKFQKQKLKELKAEQKRAKKEEKQLELDIKLSNKSNKNIKINKINENNKKNNQIKKKKRKLKGIAKLIIFILIITGLIAFLKSSFFTLNKISVKGNDKVSSDEIIKLSKLEINKNMFQKELISLNQNLKKNPYIKNSSFKINSSSEITLQIKERVEKYYITASNKFYTIDNSGMIIRETQSTPENLIKISMIKTEENKVKVGTKLNDLDIKDIEEISKILENYIYTMKNDIKVSEAYYNEKIGYVINLPEEKKLVYLGDNNKMDTKILYLKKMLEQEKGIEGEIFLNKDFKDKFPVFREKV